MDSGRFFPPMIDVVHLLSFDTFQKVWVMVVKIATMIFVRTSVREVLEVVYKYSSYTNLFGERKILSCVNFEANWTTLSRVVVR